MMKNYLYHEISDGYPYFFVVSFLTGKNDEASFYHLPRITHKDPFDRMLIWQAIREKMVLISKDGKIEAYKDYGLKILPFS